MMPKKLVGKKLRKLRKRRSGVGNPYARINWEKAKVLFQRPITKGSSHKFPPVSELLRLVAAAGAVGMSFLFPGAAPALATLILGEKSYPYWRTKQVLSQLAKRKYVTIKEHDDGRITVKITRDGKIKALTYQLEALQLLKPRHWDRKWRIVIFDIPEKLGRIRDIFRIRLQQLGLYQLQESVYVSPYKCFNEVEFLRELYGIAFTVRYLLVDKIEDDEFLKNHFHLQ